MIISRKFLGTVSSCCRKVMQARCLTQHAESTVHRVAQEVFLAPDKPISQCLPYSVADQSLFKGNVPQPQDWLRAWRACQTPSSFQSAMTFFGTDDYIAGEVSQSPWLWKVYLVFFAWVKMLQRTPSKATTRTRGSKWSKVSRSF